MNKSILLLLLVATLHACAQFKKTVFKTIAGNTIYNIEDKGIYVFDAGCMIDADGAPKAYHNNDRLALDYISNAGKPGNWWALVTNRQGIPLVQSNTDPAPGYYISMTSLEDDSKEATDPNRFVNSDSIPYIALPVGFSSFYHLGDVALVINKKNNRRCYAIFADWGPANKIGEGSIYLARQLGINSSPKHGGVESGIRYILFRQSGESRMLSKEEIERRGKEKLSPEEIEALLK